MRYIELSPKADDARTRLPARARLAVDRGLQAIANDPAPGAPGSDGPRLVAPADSENTGLIVALIRADRKLLGVTYRIRTSDDVVWVLDIREVFVG